LKTPSAPDALLRPATDYEQVAALLHHQPAAAFTSLFVLYGYGHHLCTHLSVAELAGIEASVSGQGSRRDYRFQRVVLRPLQSEMTLEVDPSALTLHCFSGCSIRQFPVFFLVREPAQLAALEAMLPQIVGQVTVRYQDWRLENAWEWALLSRAALAGELTPALDFPLMEALGWRLVRPVTEMGGRSPVLEWHLMKVAELEQSGALPLMTVLTDNEGKILRRADAQLLTVFRSAQPRKQPVVVTSAVDRGPLVQVRATAGVPAPAAVDIPVVETAGEDDYPLPERASDKVVRLQRLAG
jgi:hypothetical protein